MTLPLEGITALDISQTLPGSFCSWTLADFGAEVIKIEEPEEDQLPGHHATSPSHGPEKSATSEKEARRVYDHLQRNKKSIFLDLKQEKGRDILYQMVPRADILVEGFRPGVTQRLGMDYERLRPLNPRLIYCSLTLYGQDGPYRDFPGHEPCALALAGILSLSAEEGERPPMLGFPPADFLAGLYATVGILMALRARDLTGEGQHIDVSLTDSALTFLSMVAPLYFQGRSIPRIARRNPSAYIWETQDGKFLCTTNVEPHHWSNFCRVIGREDFIPYQTNREKRQEICDALEKIFRTRSREEWFHLLTRAKTQAAPVYELPEVFADPQVHHRQMVAELNHPSLGKIKQLGIPLKLSQTPGKIRTPAPLPGEHTEEILTQLGYSPQQIEDLGKTTHRKARSRSPSHIPTSGTTQA